jgi:hypothetical protein
MQLMSSPKLQLKTLTSFRSIEVPRALDELQPLLQQEEDR